MVHSTVLFFFQRSNALYALLYGVQLFVTDECKSRQKQELISQEAERTGTGQTSAHAVTDTRLNQLTADATPASLAE